MASEKTQINRVRRYLTKVIARADKAENDTGRAYTMASGWDARRDLARRILKELDR